MGTTLREARTSTLVTKRFAAALLMIAVAGLVASPAAALPPRGVVPAPQVPDPCGQTSPSILTFAATPSTVTLGQLIDLSWRVAFPNSCAFTVVLSAQPLGSQGQGYFAQPVGPQGTLTVQPFVNGDSGIYILTIRWGRNESSSMFLTTAPTVNLPTEELFCVAGNTRLATAAPVCRQSVTISQNNQVPLFVKALGMPNTTVIVNADLDLTGLSNRILITDGVVLKGWRSAVPGQPFQAGPLLYVRDYPSPLFQIQGDNVRVTGVRIQGPSMAQDNTAAFGMLITDVKPCLSAQLVTAECLAPPTPGHINVQIDHNEFSGWSDTALAVSDTSGRIVVPVVVNHQVTPADLVYSANPTTEPVWIHDNFFHHNLHSGTNGYGVGVWGGAHALIERNVFDNNRHAITSGREDGRVGYRAYRNLVLSNGTGDQQFDMHGSKGCNFLNIPDHWCGVAGHDFDVRYNSFVYTAGAAVLLRGTPTLGLPEGAIMRFNVFAHDHETDAVKWTEGAPTVQDNLTGRKSYPPSSVLCDFDGDGVSDTFIATEQTLWYCPGPSDCVTASGSGKPTWVYLNSSTKGVDQLSLGYFRGGAVCDVVDGAWISVGGAGPWVPLTPLTGPSGLRGAVSVPSAGVK